MKGEAMEETRPKEMKDLHLEVGRRGEEPCVYTPRVAALTREIQGLKHRLFASAQVLAEIGERLQGVRGELKEERCWRKWLADQVQFTPKTALNYIRLAELRRAIGDEFPRVIQAGLRLAYRLGGMGNGFPWKGRETRFTLPDGTQKELGEMTAEELRAALSPTHGSSRRPSKPAPACPPAAFPIQADSRGGFAGIFLERLRTLREEAKRMQKLGGELTSQEKWAVQEALRDIHREVVRWPAPPIRKGSGAGADSRQEAGGPSPEPAPR
jgi:hypothetical protein